MDNLPKSTLQGGNVVRENYGEIITLISDVNKKIERLSDKLEDLARDHVTRADIDNLRKEIQTSFVLRAEYEPRHNALISRDSSIESELKRVDSETQSEFQRLHERLESGKQQIEERLKQEREVALNSKDRSWVRVSQILGIVALIVSIVGLLLGHVRLS